jgi:hypothetical protein
MADKRIQAFFSKRSIVGWLMLVIENVLLIIAFWGDIEFVSEKTSLLQLIGWIWGIMTHPYYYNDGLG